MEPASPDNQPEPTQPEATAPPEPVQPAEPAAPEPSATPESTPAAPVVTTSNRPSGLKSKRLLLIIAAVVVVLLLAGGYVFGLYLPNQPDNVYKSSLSNSGKAVDRLIDYSKVQASVNYKSYAVTGDFKVKSSQLSFDGSLSGKFSTKGAGQLQLKVDALGEKATANIRTVKTGNQTPDFYLQVTGVKSLLDAQGLNSFDSLDGQWLEVDHTLLDTLSANVKKSADASASSTAKPPTADQITDAASRVNAVNKQYIFSTDSKTAVLNQQKFVGKETKDGRSVDHFKVGYSQSHLQAYVDALGSALDASSLNTWAKQNNDGKNLSQLMNVSQLKAQIAKAPADYSFDLWADTKTKLVHSVQFADPKDASSNFTISQNYTGGSKYPLSLAIESKDGSATLSFAIDTASNAINFSFGGSSRDGTTGNANFTVTASNSEVTETAPTGAKSVTDLLNQLGAQGVLGASTGGAQASGSTGTPMLSPSDLETFFQ